MHVNKGVRSCPTKTYYILTNGKINLNQLYLSLITMPCFKQRIINFVNTQWRLSSLTGYAHIKQMA